MIDIFSIGYFVKSLLSGREILNCLFEKFQKNFNKSELATLCFQLGIDIENIHGETRIEKARELSWYFIRHKRLDKLIEVGKEKHSHADWEELEVLLNTENENSTNEVVKLTEHNEDTQNALHINSLYSNKSNSLNSRPTSQIAGEVAITLEELGYFIELNVGPKNAAIPIAVIDKQYEKAILGIEFDEEFYYNQRSARDRDRLRKQVLEQNLNWKLHKIWTIDWY